MRQAPEGRRLPLQFVLLVGISGALMLVTWIKLANPEFSETTKAQQTARFYLDAIGKAPIEKLGAELHPQVRSAFTPESLSQYLKARQLDKAVTLKSLREESFDQKAGQWSWRADLSTGGQAFPVLLYVRKPENQTIGRRWRVYALCRPDLDLPLQARQVLDKKTKVQGLSLPADFKASPQTQWRLVGTQPLTLIVPGRTQSLTLTYSVTPDGRLGCAYSPVSAALRAQPR